MPQDLSFTFDTGPFEKGMDQIQGRMAGLQNTAGTVAKGVTRGLQTIAMQFGAVFAGAKLVQGALKNMPEVGQAFGIAKDVFVKNFLFPLRQEVFPLLQKLMDWARDNRAQFVKWGQVVANVFRSAVSGVKNLIKFARRMTQRVTDAAKNIFGNQMDSIDELFNLVTFKIATAVEFITLMASQLSGLFTGFAPFLGTIVQSIGSIVSNIGDMVAGFLTLNESGHSLGTVLETVGDLIGKMTAGILSMVDSFIEGFAPAVRNVMTPLQGIVDALTGIFDLIVDTANAALPLQEVFEAIGEVVGNVVMNHLQTLEAILTGIKTVIETIIEAVQDFGFVGALNEASRALSGLFGNMSGEGFLEGARGLGGAVLDKGRETFVDPFTSRIKVDDAIIKPDGQVIRTAPDDTLIATKNPVAMAPVVQPREMAPIAQNRTDARRVSIDMRPTIVVQQGTEEEGRNVARGLTRELEEQFNREFERGGY